MSTATKTTLSPRTLASKDAITQLRADHVKVSRLFAEYEKARTTLLVPEPTVEHRSLKDLIAQIQARAVPSPRLQKHGRLIRPMFDPRPQWISMRVLCRRSPWRCRTTSRSIVTRSEKQQAASLTIAVGAPTYRKANRDLTYCSHSNASHHGE